MHTLLRSNKNKLWLLHLTFQDCVRVFVCGCVENGLTGISFEMDAFKCGQSIRILFSMLNMNFSEDLLLFLNKFKVLKKISYFKIYEIAAFSIKWHKLCHVAIMEHQLKFQTNESHPQTCSTQWTRTHRKRLIWLR